MEIPPLKDAIPSKYQLDPPKQPWRLPWKRWHRAAAITGYGVWAYFSVWLVINLFLAATGSGGPELPFKRSYGMTGSRLLVNAQSVRAWNGDGATCQVWRLSGSPTTLRKSVTNEVLDNLVWFHRPFDGRDQKAMEFVSYFPPYAKAAPFAREIQSGDFYFAYEHLRIYDDGRVGDVGIWLFSPDKMLLVYLNGNI